MYTKNSFHSCKTRRETEVLCIKEKELEHKTKKFQIGKGKSESLKTAEQKMKENQGWRA